MTKQTVKRWLVISVLWAFALGVTLATTRAQAADETTQAVEQLNHMIELLGDLDPFVEVLDQARLLILKKSAESVLTSVKEKGLGHFATMRCYQELIVKFRYSLAFFRQIETTETAGEIRELLDLEDTIVKERGFDDTPYTQITASVFSQIHQLLLQLDGLGALPEPLASKMNALVAPVGNLIALAKQGDRPKTFAAAVPVQKRIVSLYPELSRIDHSNAAFDIILEIQGLNEFYAEYAQIEEAR